jgi:U3 small nucleolar RNA-associated protein 12
LLWCSSNRRSPSLRGHRDQVTAIKFISIELSAGPSTSTSSAPGFLLTGSKDTFLKLWDLSTQHCIQTVVAHRMEVWTLDLDAEQQLLFTGSSEGELKAWKVDKDALAEGIKETSSGEVRTPLSGLVYGAKSPSRS